MKMLTRAINVSVTGAVVTFATSQLIRIMTLCLSPLRRCFTFASPQRVATNLSIDSKRRINWIGQLPDPVIQIQLGCDLSTVVEEKPL